MKCLPPLGIASSWTKRTKGHRRNSARLSCRNWQKRIPRYCDFPALRSTCWTTSRRTRFIPGTMWWSNGQRLHGIWPISVIQIHTPLYLRWTSIPTTLDGYSMSSWMKMWLSTSASFFGSMKLETLFMKKMWRHFWILFPRRIRIVAIRLPTRNTATSSGIRYGCCRAWRRLVPWVLYCNRILYSSISR